MSHTTVQPHSSLAEYFHEVISQALRRQGVEASAHAEHYLVNLLAAYSHAPLSDEPLSLQLAQAQAAEPTLRLRKLREIGDHSLYVTGFFADSLESKLIDVDFYISIGGTAYANLSRAYAAPPWSETFWELADKFRQLVEVLGEVSAQTPLKTNTDLLQLYERYLRTGSRFTARRLRKLGLGVLPEDRTGRGQGGGAC